MGQIIASGNLKGGTGKSTIAVNLACAFASTGRRVALLDVDPQGTAADWARRGNLPIEVVAAPPVDLRGSGSWPRRAVELARGYDLVVLDLPPLLGGALAAAFMLADLALVPITPSLADVGPTAQTIRLLGDARASRRGERPQVLLVANMVDLERKYDRATREALESLGERWAPVVHRHAEHTRACAAGSWVGACAPDSRAAGEMMALMRAAARRLRLDVAPGSTPADPATRAPVPV